MSRAPRIIVEVNEQRWRDLCSSLGFDSARVIRFRRFPPKMQRDGRQIYGQAQRDPQRIFIYLCITHYDTARFRDVQRELVVTLLHELKHLHQFSTWTHDQWAKDDLLPYSFKVSERDAENFAQAQAGKWMDVAKVKRVYRSSLTRLSEAESRVVR
jgi:hypothetical protein